jgi:hypothetical protein
VPQVVGSWRLASLPCVSAGPHSQNAVTATATAPCIVEAAASTLCGSLRVRAGPSPAADQPCRSRPHIQLLAATVIFESNARPPVRPPAANAAAAPAAAHAAAGGRLSSRSSSRQAS